MGNVHTRNSARIANSAADSTNVRSSGSSRDVQLYGSVSAKITSVTSVNRNTVEVTTLHNITPNGAIICGASCNTHTIQNGELKLIKCLGFVCYWSVL